MAIHQLYGIRKIDKVWWLHPELQLKQRKSIKSLIALSIVEWFDHSFALKLNHLQYLNNHFSFCAPFFHISQRIGRRLKGKYPI